MDYDYEELHLLKIIDETLLIKLFTYLFHFYKKLTKTNKFNNLCKPFDFQWEEGKFTNGISI